MCSYYLFSADINTAASFVRGCKKLGELGFPDDKIKEVLVGVVWRECDWCSLVLLTNYQTGIVNESERL